MKVNELRIENLVYDAFNAEAIVCDITQTGININHGYSTISINELKPIPLTEEWLLKFGFENDNIEWWNGIISIGIYKDGLFYCPTGQAYIRKGNEIQNVHTLQNLYFALTGEELTFKSK